MSEISIPSPGFDLGEELALVRPRLLRALRASGRLGVTLAFAIVLAQGLAVRYWTDDIAAEPPAAVVEPTAPALEPTVAPTESPEPPSPGPDLPSIAAPRPAMETPAIPVPTLPATATPAPTATRVPTATAIPTATAARAAPSTRTRRLPALAAGHPPLRGIGYNPTYATADAPESLRAERLRRDLAAMSQVGIDMVLGWEPGVFDSTLVAAAEENGVGVLLPFELRPEYNYSEPETREQLTQAVLDWVARYRDQPAVLMWAIGNEATLPMDADQRWQYADFYAELFARVRAADPTRPVVLREAEDVFAPTLADAFERHGLGRRVDGVLKAPTGFVFGVNFYTDRVGPALGDWVENTGLDTSLLVSEYAPAGVGRAARAERLRQMHAAIVAAGPRVVGSAPYTWTTAGPEAVDAYFGLVDEGGRPVDGSLAELARLYGVAPPGWAMSAVAVEDGDDPAELSRLIDTAVAEAARLGARDADQVRAGVLAQTQEAAVGLNVGQDDGRAEGAWSVAQLIGWARELSTVRLEDQRLFPGLHEALPLLDGMARWSAVEPSADETARSFVASVLRRDLQTAAALGRR